MGYEITNPGANALVTVILNPIIFSGNNILVYIIKVDSLHELQQKHPKDHNATTRFITKKD